MLLKSLAPIFAVAALVYGLAAFFVLHVRQSITGEATSGDFTMFYFPTAFVVASVAAEIIGRRQIKRATAVAVESS